MFSFRVDAPTFLVPLTNIKKILFTLNYNINYLTGLVPRLERELRAVRPFESTFNINLASDPTLDAWRGASEFGRVAPPSSYITRADYLEHGADYFAEHCASNRRFALNKH